MNYGFTSSFTKDLEDMITLKTSFGFSEDTYLSRARDFDRHCTKNYPKADRLTEPIAISWLKSGISKADGTLRRKTAFVRAFGRYQRSAGKDAYVISEMFTAGKNIFVPYIFSDDELKKLFHEIDSYEKNGNPLEGALLSTYFRLIYTCGLRPNEGRLLRRSEISLGSGEIRIINTKWHKSRTAVMSEDMRTAAAAYATMRDAAFPENGYFFPKPDGNPYTATWMGGKFRKFFAKSKKGEPSDLLPSVRVYDLRHRFATANLSRWLDKGIDIHSRLPYLQSYMGHKELSATAYYIHLLPENLVKSSGIDWEHMNRLVPEVELWEN